MSEFKFTPKKGSMANSPLELQSDLLERMKELLMGISHDLDARSYAFIKVNPLDKLNLSENQLEKLYSYYHRTFNKMASTVLSCANNADYDWSNLVRLFLNAENYHRGVLSDSEIAEYKAKYPTWKNHVKTSYLDDNTFKQYKTLLKSSKSK